MKNTILVLIAFVYCSINAQEVILKKGEKVKELKKGAYYKLPNELIEKYEGIWEYRSQNDTFKVKIKRKKTFIKGSEIYIDVLNGSYCYNKNDGNCQIDDETLGLKLGGPYEMLYNNLVEFMFIDFQNDKTGKVIFEITGNGKAHWILKNDEGIRILKDGKRLNGKEPWTPKFSVPIDVLLTKQH